MKLAQIYNTNQSKKDPLPLETEPRKDKGKLNQRIETSLNRINEKFKKLN